MNKEIAKELQTVKVLLKLIVKKLYNLSDTQYERAMKRMEEDSNVSVEQYLNGVDERNEYKEFSKGSSNEKYSVKK